MNLIKYVWAARAVLYKTRFKRFGNFSYIGSPLILTGLKKVSIGRRVRIYPGVRIEAWGDGRITIEDNVSIGQNLHLTSVGSNLVIGENTTISGNVLITNNGHQYEEIGKHVMDQGLYLRETTIGKNCFIGYGAVILEGTTLGEHCVVGANAVVKGNFPAYSVLTGAPARVVKKYNLKTKQWEKPVQAAKLSAAAG